MREFKLEAVRLCEEDDRPVAEIARQLADQGHKDVGGKERSAQKGWPSQKMQPTSNMAPMIAAQTTASSAPTRKVKSDMQTMAIRSAARGQTK